MRAKQQKLTISVLALAVQGALAAMAATPLAAMAEGEDDVATLVNPTNYVEAGVANVSHDSPKFGEYNGLNKNGGYGIVNFGVKGGDSYGQNTGTRRWSVTGSDLGTSSRAIGGSVGDQGSWNLGVNYDELRHYTTTNFQSPYQGSVGGNSFNLPAGFSTVANTRTGLTATQAAAIQTQDVHNDRKNTAINGSFNFNANLQFTFDYNHLDQSGAKLQAFGSMGAGGAGGEAVSLLPMPTNYKTDTINLALNYTGDAGYATGSYYGSFFRDAYTQVNWMTFNGANTLQTMSTPPDNNFHQLNLTGGYAFSPTTKFAGGLSYSRNTQNDAYQTFGADAPMLATGYPTQSSLNGLVVNKHLDAKVTNQTTKDLTVWAGFKYDNRSNRTAASIYGFNAIDASASHWAFYSNTPLSVKKTQLELAGDYRISRDRHLVVAYNYEDVKKWCDNYAGNGTRSNGSNTLGTIYGAGGNCVTNTGNQDNKLSATYRFKAGDSTNANIGYVYDRRKADFDQNAIAAFITNRTVAGSSTTLPEGQNAADFPGFHPWFEASRTEQVLKAGANWQANEKLSLGVNGRYTDDDYNDQTYGVGKGKSAMLNFDATYAYSDTGTFSAYLTQQERQRDLFSQANNANTNWTGTTGSSATRLGYPAGTTWSNTLKDEDTTIGISFKQSDLMQGKLDLAGDLSYSTGKTNYNTASFLSSDSTGRTCSNSFYLNCGSTPDVKNDMVQFKLVGTYKIDKSSKVALGYMFQRLKSTDYFYNGYQYGYTPTAVMPDNQQPGSYSVNVVSASYIYSFK